MKKRILASVLALTLISAAFTGCGSAAQAKELTKDTGIGINIDYSKPSMQPVQQFGYELLAQNLKDTNPILSPVSAYIALCMLGKGAAGETEEELRGVLGGDMMCIPDDLMNTLPQNEKRAQLSIANSAWLDDMFAVEEQWLGTVKSLFDAEAYQADLGADAVMNDVNQWVSDNTNQMIPKLLEKPLGEDARLALINALYFHADWEQAFHAANTRACDFNLDDGTVQQVSMMFQTFENCGYFEDDTAKGVVLPYADSSFAFAAVMPKGSKNIREWYASYTPEKLDALIKSSKQTDTSVSLPKFTASYKKRLNESLQDMGIALAFDEGRADFSALGKDKAGARLYVSLILQEAVIEVAEKGTEAAAATEAVLSAGGAMPMELQEVYFDRPFLYMIMDMESGAPVFMGILDEPASARHKQGS